MAHHLGLLVLGGDGKGFHRVGVLERGPCLPLANGIAARMGLALVLHDADVRKSSSDSIGAAISVGREIGFNAVR